MVLGLAAMALPSNLLRATNSEKEIIAEANYELKGKVIAADTNEPLPYASVAVLGSSLGAVSDENGHFVIHNVPRREVTVRISYVGYGTEELELVAGRDNQIRLQPTSINMQEVVVSANRVETRRNLAPVLVNVTGDRLFKATNAVTVDQALKFNPGIRVEDNCQNCGFNQVRINGLDGSYSQIVINSRSIFSSLAGVYGLEMIPTAMIDRVEVVRGGGSALYGSSAIGGTINIITKAPTTNMAEATYTISGVHDNYGRPMHDAGFFASVVDDSLNAGISVFGKMTSRPAYAFVRPNSKIKKNLNPANGTLFPRDGDDGFSEIPFTHGGTIGTSAFLKVSPTTNLKADYFFMQEDRRGGDMIGLFPEAPFKPEHEAHVAEALRHRIHTGILQLDQYVADGHGYLTAFLAGSHTNRHSYYGGGPVNPAAPTADDKAALGAYGLTKDLTMQTGLQYVHNFDKLLFMPSELTLGIEHHHNKLNDDSGYRKAGNINQVVNTTSGIFQNEWNNDTFGFLIGARYDHVNISQGRTDNLGNRKLNIITPRVTFRYNPLHNLHLRAGYAQGFRAPQVFDEDLHVDSAGGETFERVLSSDLKEERSQSVTLSADYYMNLGNGHQLNLMGEGFWTQLKDKFNTSDPKNNIKTVYNAKSIANVYGANIELRYAYRSLFSLSLGFTAQKSLFNEPEDTGIEGQEMKEFMRTPDTYGYFVATWTPTHHFTWTLSGDYTGKMWVPHEAPDDFDANFITLKEGKVERSPAFFTLSTKLGYTFDIANSLFEINGGVNNILNSYQKDFDEGPGRASAYIYGPKMPRNVFVGVKLTI